jgi:tetracycline 7-halogenase / FADH2 O2-dependent halogenase
VRIVKPERAHVVVAGAGFAGALLARLLARQGLDVVLIDRGRHPRFAIGESSTPLASLCLDRLGRTYGQRDLTQLATHGRSTRHLPHLRTGLKRGFTFYRHQPGRAFANGPYNDARLLVAASPNDAVADAQWMRADVDHHLVREAVAAGVDYRDETTIGRIAVDGRGVTLATDRQGERRAVRAETIVDATGPGGLLRRALRIPSALARTSTRSALLFSHFEDARLFQDVGREAGASMASGPYPDDWSALHHVLDEGWMYVLRFDDGLVSAGLLATPDGAERLRLAERDPAASWTALMRRYPSVGAQFADAQPVFPIRLVPRVQHRLARAAGPRWVMLPHTFAFVDPLFSTGIAWSLLAVERLTDAFVRSRTRGVLATADERRYDALLAREGDQIDRVVAGAYLAMPDFALFAAQTMLYFGVVSYAESKQRLVGGDGWTPFLGALDPAVEDLYRGALARLRRMRDRVTPRDRHAFVRFVTEGIEPWNIGGLMDPARRNLYPVDLDTLVARAGKLGLTRDTIRRALPRLRR